MTISDTAYTKHGKAQRTELSTLAMTGLTQGNIEFLHHQKPMRSPETPTVVTSG